MPRYDRYERLRRDIANSVKRGSIVPKWAEDSQSFTYTFDGKSYRYDLESMAAAEVPAEAASRRTRDRRNPERGRQFDTVQSKDGKLTAFCRDRNVILSNGRKETVVTTDGSVEKRIKNGVASWVYGEELGVREAMWFSPDSRWLAFYRFDETPVQDFYLALDVTKFQSKQDIEAYPKAGTPNPIVSLRLYEVRTGRTVEVDTRFGPEGASLGEYVYQVRWSEDGSELFYHRTNRLQNVMQWCAFDPEKGTTRVVIEERHPESWTDNAPQLRILKDGKRFIWRSDRDGFYNLYLYDLSGKLLKTLTKHPFDVASIVEVNENDDTLFYTARSAANPYLMQLHRVRLDGTQDVRLTDPQFSHTVYVAPDGRHVVDVAERLDVAPETYLLDSEGKKLATLASSDVTKFESLGLRKAERLEFLAADGMTKLYGTLEFPSDFDPAKRYPVVVGTYAGPESGGGQERFRVPNPITEMGFLVADFEGRGTSGRGKAFKEAVYGKLGVVEIDDQAAGGKYLQSLPYVHGGRIGIHGTSYGGYASLMALLRHPDVFRAACASSSVTDWRQYDTIYTERYMGLPEPDGNLAGYEAGSSLTYVKNLKGRLMLFYGTADNNVHPNNTLQLAKALNEAGKSYEMMVGPDLGHASINYSRMWEFFMDNLVLSPSTSEPLRKYVHRRGR
jgi:dipeptidyl-peptidase 4